MKSKRWNAIRKGIIQWFKTNPHKVMTWYITKLNNTCISGMTQLQYHTQEKKWAKSNSTYFPSNMVWLMVTMYPAPPTSKYGAVRVTWPGNSKARVNHDLLVGSKVLSSSVPGNILSTPLGVATYLQIRGHADISVLIPECKSEVMPTFQS